MIDQILIKDTMVAILSPNRMGKSFAFEDGIFGVNAEVTRKGFFSGLSAQMLNNRKFLMGKEGVDGWICSDFERVLDRPEESLCQSNFVILKNGGQMSQSSDVITLIAGKEYEAKIWVKSVSAESKVVFGIEGFEQEFTLKADERKYIELSYTFTAGNTETGIFMVSVLGEVCVFEASLMPTDHFYGMRLDVIESLQELAPTAIRFPGGCYAEYFDWKESLKAPEYRKPIDTSEKIFILENTYHQDCLDIGLNEFAMLCQKVGAAFEYTVSMFLSDGEDARRLIEYCNGDTDTEYGAIRSSLGFDKFNIKTWYIGNEVYCHVDRYAKDASLAAERTNEIVSAMRKVDPDMRIVICMVGVEGCGYRDWSIACLKKIDCRYDLVSYHSYNGTAPTSMEDGVTVCKELETAFLNDTDTDLDFYKNQLFADRFESTNICVDEWNFCWGHGANNAFLFSNALYLHFLARNAEKYHIREARFFMPVNEGMITVTPFDSKVESTGEMFCLMAKHKGGRVIECKADTEALDILCTEHEGELYVSVINRSSVPYRIEVDGQCAKDIIGIKINDFNFFSNDYTVESLTDTVIDAHGILFFTSK